MWNRRADFTLKNSTNQDLEPMFLPQKGTMTNDVSHSDLVLGVQKFSITLLKNMTSFTFYNNNRPWLRSLSIVFRTWSSTA